MKTTILSILFLTLSLGAISQESGTYITFSGGISRPYTKPVLSLTGGYQFDNGFFAEGSMRFVPSRKIGNAVYNPKLIPESPAHFGIFIGYEIPVSSLYLSPMVGYHYRIVSSDIPRLNGWDGSAGLRVRKGRFIAEYHFIGKYQQGSIGMYLTIPENN